MKKLLLILMFMPFMAFAQFEDLLPFKDDGNGNLIFQKVVETDSINQKTLFSNSENWVLKSFKDPKSVIQLINRDEYSVVIKAISPTKINFRTSVFDYNIEYLLTIESKENRYRYTFSNILFKQQGMPDQRLEFYLTEKSRPTDGKINPDLLDFPEKAKQVILQISESLEGSMNIKSESDW